VGPFLLAIPFLIRPSQEPRAYGQFSSLLSSSFKLSSTVRHLKRSGLPLGFHIDLDGMNLH